MRVFITDATGCIGSKIVEELIRAGHRVTEGSSSPDQLSSLIALRSKRHPA